MQARLVRPANVSPSLAHNGYRSGSVTPGLMPKTDTHSATATSTTTTGTSLSARADTLFPGVGLTHPADKPLIPLIKRTLCPDANLTSDPGATTAPQLPPLTSSNEVDLQLYGFLAIIIKEFIVSWYGKITPDREFIDEVIHLVAHITRALEGRLRRVDLIQVLLDEVCGLLDDHIVAYRTAHAAAEDSTDLETIYQVYHSIHNHAALSPIPTSSQGGGPDSRKQQSQNEAAWRRLLVEGLLAVLLPTEDLENPLLKTLLTEILAETVMGNALNRAAQGFVLWDGITNALGGSAKSGNSSGKQGSGAYARRKRPGAGETPDDSGSLSESRLSIPPDERSSFRTRTVLMLQSSGRVFWSVCQALTTLVLMVHSFIVALMGASSLPERKTRRRKEDKSRSRRKRPSLDPASEPVATPIMSLRLWSCLNSLTQFDKRAPWLSSLLSYFRWILTSGPMIFLSPTRSRLCETDGLLDRLLMARIQQSMNSPEVVSNLLRSVRMVVFPNNMPGPPRPPDPDVAEYKLIRERSGRTIVSRLPAFVVARIAGLSAKTGDGEEGPSRGEREKTESKGVPLSDPLAAAAAAAQIAEMLRVFEDSYLNKHFVFAVVETVMAHVVPELSERGVGELLSERLG